jgi:hypothetical protein
VIESFLAVHGAGDTWTFSGHVADEDAAGLTIRFAGLTSLMGQTVVVDENGNFSFTGSISEDDLDGTVTAITTDWWGLNSGLANYSLS